ncbi:MAG: CoA transferase subunit A [Chloroflexi bacterium]|nr:CoA transferase subunit A [Chloroflexota bacterium]
MTLEAHSQPRKSKLGTVKDALSLIHDNMYVAFGGHVYFNKASHMVRAIAKKRVKGLTLSGSPYASYEMDLLIAVGAVKKVMVGNLGFEYLGLAPNFRKAVQLGTIETVVGDESTLIGGYMATVEGIPYHPIISIKGSDILKISPIVKLYKPPWGNEEIVAVQALSPDVAILHAQEADEYGNARYKGQPYFDQIIAKASKKVILTVDEIISHDKVAAEPEKTVIPGLMVEMVVHLPFGAHPCLSTRNYVHDEAHLKDYIQRSQQSLKAGDTAPLDEYLRKYVYEPESIYDYLDRVGGLERMTKLKMMMELGRDS